MGISSSRRLGDRKIKILALDLAGRTGVAALFAHGGIRIGTVKVDRGRNAKSGRRNPLPAVRLWRRLNLLLKDIKVECVVFEETFAQGNAKYRLDSMQFVVTLWAVENGISWARISPTAWKKAMTGRGNISKPEYHEEARNKWPEHTFNYDDEAAARFILEYVRLPRLKENL